MSSRPQFNPAPVITNGNMASASLTSAVTIIQKLSMISYGVSWTGSTPIGTLQVQVSNDYKQDASGVVSVAGTWNTMTLNYQGMAVTSIPVTGNTGSAFIDIEETAGYAIRLVYTKTSGTGTLQATVNGKVA